jgi:hypothetical protein
MIGTVAYSKSKQKWLRKQGIVPLKQEPKSPPCRRAFQFEMKISFFLSLETDGYNFT